MTIIIIILIIVSILIFFIIRKQTDTTPEIKESEKSTAEKTATEDLKVKTDTLFKKLPKQEKDLFADEQKSGFILEIEKGSLTGKQIILIGTQIFIGRSASNDVTIDDPMVSDKHIKLFIKPGISLYLEDLNSTNGTMVNGKKTKKTDLKADDLIQIGNTQLRFKKEEN